MEQTLLEHPEKAEGANNIVIVGGGVVGCETAHWLANEYGKNVTVLEMLPHFMMGSVQQTEDICFIIWKNQGCGCITVQR